MEQTQTSWRNDPRLKGMDPKKLDLLVSFSNRIAHMPKNELLGAFMELNQETAVIAEILTGHLSESDKKKLETLRLLSRKLSRKK